MIRSSYRVAGLKYAVSVQLWKLWQLLKVSVGVWDRDVLLATNVMRRADRLLRHDVTLPEQRHPKGLQIHQDIISATGRMVSTVFCLFPFGAFLAKVRRAPASFFCLPPGVSVSFHARARARRCPKQPTTRPSS